MVIRMHLIEAVVEAERDEGRVAELNALSIVFSFARAKRLRATPMTRLRGRLGSS
jgi:hypothetical protein